MDDVSVTETNHHAVFDDKLHQVFLYRSEECLTRVIHQRHDQLQDLGHIANYHEVILGLKMKERKHRTAVTCRPRLVVLVVFNNCISIKLPLDRLVA